MRLVFVNRFFYPDHSATSQILSDLCFALAARGHEVHVVTSRLRYDDPSVRLAPRETASLVEVHRVWTSRYGRGSLPGRALDYLTFYLSAGWRLLRLADRRTILVAKTDPPMVSVVAAAAARLKRARLVNWTQDLFPEVAVAVGMRVMRPALARVLAAMRDWSLAGARLTVAIGEQMGARIAARGIATERIAVIHNWADGEAIVPLPQGREPEDRQLRGEGDGQSQAQAQAQAQAQGAARAMDSNPLRREWGLEGRFVIGYSGNFGRVHEFATVLEAASLLADRADIVFVFIGGGHQLDALKAEAVRRGLGNVQFRDYQPRERLALSLGACDAHLVTLQPALEGLVVPSKFYGIIAAGRPVLFVGAREGEIARLIEAGECGQAVAVGEARALADAILRLAREPELARRWGGNARRLFDARFAMPIAIASWERCLREVAGEDGR